MPVMSGILISRKRRSTWRDSISGNACRDRKSTRLNSSHLGISYAVFCLKKKIPAAVENQSTEKNASSVHAKILCEGANGPTTWQADAILDNKGVFTVPDILGNAGGVTVSYFEWVQDRQGFFWRESEVNERLMDIMVNAFDVVVKYAEKHKVNNRIAAYMVAIDRVAKALKMRGIYA